MNISFLNTLDKGWPFAAAVIGGTLVFGTLTSDVHQLKQDQIINALDHDKITTLVQGQADVKESLVGMKAQLDRIEAQRAK